MDSRVRGNDGGNPHILREKLILEFRQNDRKIKFTIPANAGISAGDSGLHRNGKAAEFREKNAVIPAKAGIYSGRLILEFREFYGKLSLEFPRIFFRKKRGECGNLSVKMDSRVRGNDGGEAGICRRESDGGGGDSDLHRNGKSWKLGK